MVLSDKFGGNPKPNLVKQTLIYVLSFGLGALLIVGVLSFTFVTIADSLLPGDKNKSTAQQSDDDGGKSDDKRPSKSRRGRGSEASDGEEL
jgi:hypothetical protein